MNLTLYILLFSCDLTLWHKCFSLSSRLLFQRQPVSGWRWDNNRASCRVMTCRHTMQPANRNSEVQLGTDHSRHLPLKLDDLESVLAEQVHLCCPCEDSFFFGEYFSEFKSHSACIACLSSMQIANITYCRAVERGGQWEWFISVNKELCSASCVYISLPSCVCAANTDKVCMCSSVR